MRRSISVGNIGRFIFGIAVCLGMLGGPAALGQSSHQGRSGGRQGSAGQDHPSKPESHGDFVPPPAKTVLTPHGGAYLITEANYYEIVFMPLQVRIYLYDKSLKALSARGVHGEMSLQIPLESEVRRTAFQYVAPPAAGGEQDYLVAAFDFGELPGNETPISLALSGLPDHRYPTASFTPLFSRSKTRPYVAQVLLTDADRPGVARQQICPVSGDALGSKGSAIKILIGEYPLYLCCQGCIAAVKQTPEKYVPQPRASAAGR